MMFSRVAAFTVAALPLLAAATPLAARGGEGSCSTGPVQCCNSTEKGIVGDIGLGCSPITVIGAGTGSACSSNAVCCQNNNVGGLISIGCVPVIL
ncbi:fungal hydrophobin [Fomes fomentarius]|nr:fungal hydrophobin [Fomes fomentarius]